jgi:CSLREA domain-containing protein
VTIETRLGNNDSVATIHDLPILRKQRAQGPPETALGGHESTQRLTRWSRGACVLSSANLAGAARSVEDCRKGLARSLPPRYTPPTSDDPRERRHTTAISIWLDEPGCGGSALWAESRGRGGGLAGVTRPEGEISDEGTQSAVPTAVRVLRRTWPDPDRRPCRSAPWDRRGGAHAGHGRIGTRKCHFAVNTTADAHDVNPGGGKCADSAGQCTLRAAVEAASAEPSGTLVSISVPAGTYSLTLGSLKFTANAISVTGAGSWQR